MVKIRVSAVKYANTYPFIYGLTESAIHRKIYLETDHPAACAAKLTGGSVDVGLIPVAAIHDLPEHHILGNYCIGANGEVRTVMMLSNSSFDSIETVCLDYRSRSSVALARVLAAHHWKREFNWKNTQEGFRFDRLGPGEAAVLIGDQCFALESIFRHKWDLAMEWKNYTGLPFVFACWVSNRQLDNSFAEEFDEALKTGVDNIDAVVEKYGKAGTISGAVLKDYLSGNIDFNLDADKRKAMEIFTGLIKSLQ